MAEIETPDELSAHAGVPDGWAVRRTERTMIDWKAVATHQRHKRRLAEEQEIRLKQQLWAEQEKRATLANTLTDFLLDIAYDETDTEQTYCLVCHRSLIEEGGHQTTCLYVRALTSIREAGRSTGGTSQ